ncbi:hypothetical protein [Holzapfeliella floricola]|uniref:Uncharacterized protein n=1 Tax=Holzapfeliella floricola DSM 23037 = JCM 16512 TaxID=1423744 RepID=A0A0R2DTB5_9LACO|nr:hypothetical protein [Holzapfeliella floricola]KRN04167.1 hypothetical protein FC86_GL000264 [Holzapfeliella floricola DSM 23037 = JCM 16512]
MSVFLIVLGILFLIMLVVIFFMMLGLILTVLFKFILPLFIIFAIGMWIYVAHNRRKGTTKFNKNYFKNNRYHRYYKPNSARKHAENVTEEKKEDTHD